MKNSLKIYAKTFGFIVILFILISLILTTILSFIQMPNTIYRIIVETLSFLTIIASAVYFYKQTTKQLLLHSCFFGFLYFLLILVLQFHDLNIITLLARPLAFIGTNVALTYLGK